MTFFRLILFTSILIIFSSCTANPVERVSDNDPSVEINQLLNAIEPGLVRASLVADNEGLQLSSLTVTLSTAFSDSTDGGIKVLIFEIGQSRKQTETSEFKVKMTSPPIGSSETSENIEKFVSALIKLVSNASKSVAGLTQSEVSGTLKFALVQKISAGGAKEWDAIPISISASKNLSSEYIHTLSIVFTKKAVAKGDEEVA